MAMRPIHYEPHPVSRERKAEILAAGFRIIDAKFRPADEPAAAAVSSERMPEGDGQSAETEQGAEAAEAGAQDGQAEQAAPEAAMPAADEPAEPAPPAAAARKTTKGRTHA
jgi:hypothetical protein